jgi:hypothetical protein
MNILLSYPNAGRTWISSMLVDLQCDIKLAHMGPFEDIDVMFKFMEKYPNRFINDKIVFLHRELRDNVVSNYFQFTRRIKYLPESMSMQEYIRHDVFGIERLIKYNLYWKEFSAVAGKLIVSYEEMRNNSEPTLVKILNFADTQYSKNSIIDSMEKNSFENMRKDEESGIAGSKRPVKDWIKRATLSDPESFKCRKGKIGGYVDYLSQDDIRYCDDLIHKYDYINRMNL